MADDTRQTIALLGDIMMTRSVSVFREPEYLKMRDMLSAADAVFANFESCAHPYLDHPHQQRLEGGSYVTTEPVLLKDLKWLGVNIVACGSGHADDYGVKGIFDTMRYLDEAGIVHAGLGRHLAEARAPAYLETATGRRVLHFLVPAGTTAPHYTVTVAPHGSIATALLTAEPGTEVVVEPGEYREPITLRSGVRVVSRIPRAAVLRLSGSAADNETAVTASGVRGAQFIGFRIVGDAATPMGTAIYVEHADLAIVDVEISGAKNAGVEFGDAGGGMLIGSSLIDNFGPALIVRPGASPRISHNYVTRKGAETLSPSLIVESDAAHFERACRYRK